MSKLHLNTISSPLGDALVKIMQTSAFNPFYLAGGTALSLQRGHRQSIDIDLFTDIEYGTLNTTGLSDALLHLFARVDRVEELTQRQMVYSMYVGNEPDEMIKLDLCYDEHPIFNPINKNGIRMADERDIAAMKIEAITQTNQRKKDFWDIHDLLETYTLEDLLNFHEKRYPWGHDRNNILKSIERCNQTTDNTDVICLKNKYWEFIVEDLMDVVANL